MKHDPRGDRRRPMRGDEGRGSLEVIWMPQVVVAKVGNILAAGFGEAMVVGRPLRAGVGRQIEPADPRVAASTNDRFAVIGAAVANHEHLEVGMRLCQHRPQGQRQRCGPVVGGDDDGEERWYCDGSPSWPRRGIEGIYSSAEGGVELPPDLLGREAVPNPALPSGGAL